jgi:RNA polymerase sigma-70 factor (ECF subfamily)
MTAVLAGTASAIPRCKSAAPHHGTPVRIDTPSLAAAYAEHRGAIYGLAYHILQDDAAAQDVVQDAFVKLWTGRGGQFDPARGSMIGLLRIIARHNAIDRMRSASRRLRIEGAYHAAEPDVVEGPERAMERSEETRALMTALSALPSDQRRVIEMAYFSELTCRQIAGEITVPIGTVKSRMRLGMRKLALRLGGRAAVEPPVCAPSRLI